MIHGNAAYCAPSDIGSLKTIDKPHDIVCAAGRLPIVKFLWGHFTILQTHSTATSWVVFLKFGAPVTIFASSPMAVATAKQSA